MSIRGTDGNTVGRRPVMASRMSETVSTSPPPTIEDVESARQQHFKVPEYTDTVSDYVAVPFDESVIGHPHSYSNVNDSSQISDQDKNTAQDDNRSLSVKTPKNPIFKDVFSNGEASSGDLPSASKFTDFLSKDIARAKLVKILAGTIFVVGIVVIVALGYMASRPSTPKTSATPTATANQQASPGVVLGSGVVGGFENPVASKLKDLPTPSASQIKADVSESSITLSSGYVVSFKGFKNTPAQSSCTVDQPTDFCFSGTVSKDGVNGKIYTLRDAVHSRLLDGGLDYKESGKPNTVAAGTLTITTDASGSRTSAVVIATGDGAGVMVTTGSQKEAEALMKSVEITKH